MKIKLFDVMMFVVCFFVFVGVFREKCCNEVSIWSFCWDRLFWFILIRFVMLVISLVLCVVVFYVIWNILVKFSSDCLLVVVCMDVVGVFCVILLLFFVSLLLVEVWFWLFGVIVL